LNQQQKRRGTKRAISGAIIVPAVLFLEQVALGANDSLLAAIAAGLEISSAIIILFLLMPDAAFWRRAWLPLLTVLAALGWLASPSFVPQLPGSAERIAPDLLLPGLSRAFGGVALLLAAAWIGYRRGMMRVALRWIMLLGLIDILIGVALRAYDPDTVWGLDKGILQERFTGTLLNANSSGCLFGVFSLLALGGLLTRLREGNVGGVPGQVWTFLDILGLIAGLGACAITGSRSALVFAIALMLLVLVSDAPLRRLMLSWTGFIFAVVGAVVAATLAVTVGDLTFGRFAALISDGGERLDMWTHYSRLVAESPWVGYGPLSFSEVNMRAIASPAEATAYWYINAPHNVLLSLLLAGGWPYLTLLGTAGLLMLVRIVRSGRRDSVLNAALASAMLIIACAMVDITLDVPAIASLLVALVGLAWGRAIRTAVDVAALRRASA
jgi:O-antigen ligase